MISAVGVFVKVHGEVSVFVYPDKPEIYFAIIVSAPLVTVSITLKFYL